MKLSGLVAEDDYLLHQLPDSFASGISADPKWFERLYFSLHDRAGEVLLITGFGIFPNASVADAFVGVCDGTAQRNVRMCRDLAGRRTSTAVGPLTLTMIEPMRRWNLALEDTEGVAFDVTFEAQTVPYSVGLIEFKRDDGPNTAFRHYNQRGGYDGWLELDGERRDVEDWVGQRDHSWGLRQPRERLGLHFWIVAHFDDRTLMASYNESREHEVVFCEGAVLFTDDREPIAVTDLRHELTLGDNGLQSTSARLRFVLEDGTDVQLTARPSIPDLRLAGTGHGGWHGQHRGDLHVESDSWRHDSAPDLMEQRFGMVDQLAVFETADAAGIGVLEMGVSRSSSYSYEPRW